ncbi:MAG: hypothetical protein KDI82_08050 [Gammaproteobacteria bacterium]|nr:hypothetical protein [Gammaproteobacteria bacterium]
MKAVLTALLILIAMPLAADQAKVATFVVNSQPAAAMVEVVRPLLGSEGSVSAFHDKLIVRGTPQQITEVRRLLEQVDRPARRLLIEVRLAGSHTLSGSDVGYGAAGDSVRLGDAPPGTGAQLYYRNLETRARDHGTQRVQALDGRPALIRTGQSVPVYRAHQQVIGNSLVQGFDVSYRDSLSGFYALPRVHGDQVTVEIYQQHERAAENGRFNLQHASTVLRGSLGQWLPLGATGGTQSDGRDSFGRHVQTRRADDRQIDLRVIAVD